MQGGAATVDVLTFADLMCRRTRESIESLNTLRPDEQAAIAQYWKDLESSMRFLCSNADEKTRHAAERLLGSGLALGFYHPANSAAVEQAQAEARRDGTKAARSKASELQHNKEGAQAHIEVRRLCFALWKSKPEILKMHPWVKETARQIRQDVIVAMEPHISYGSMWAASAEGLDLRMENPIRKAGADISHDPSQIF